MAGGHSGSAEAGGAGADLTLESAQTADALARTSTRAWVNRTLSAVPLVLLTLTGWAHRNMIDDGFIYLRVIKMIGAGHGPVFNSGQRVEAFTSPAWVALLTVGSILPFKLEWISVCLGLALSVAGVAFALAGARRLTVGDNRDSVFVPVGALVFVAVFAVQDFATSGMETGLTFAWEGLCLWLLARWATAPHRKIDPPSAIIIGLGWVIRPEMLLYSGLFAAVLLAGSWRTDRARDRARLIGWMFAIPIAYQVFRMGFYGSVVTNTAIAKEGGLANWRSGKNYLRDFVRPYNLWWQLLVLGVGAYLPLALSLRSRREYRCAFVVAAFVVAGLLNAYYVTRVGGDWLHARLLLPAFFALCAPVAVVPITKRYLVSVALAIWVLVVGTGFRPPPHQRHPARRVMVADFYLSPPRGCMPPPMCSRSKTYGSRPVIYYERWYPFGLVPLRTVAAPGIRHPTLAVASLGVMGYALGPDWYVYDMLGLADPLTAHLKLQHRGPTGHEKPIPEYWTVARLTTQDTNLVVSAFPRWVRPMISPAAAALDEEAFAEQVEWARANLQCGSIRRLEQATDAPLTVGRFFSNFLHSYQNTKLRIPANARTANRQICKH